MFSGKSLISKEKAIQTADKQDLKQNPDPVFFISLVGMDNKGNVDEHEHIFDIYTKWYDFLGSNVKVLSAQDLRDYYKSKHPDSSTSDTDTGSNDSSDSDASYSDTCDSTSEADVYQMAEFFVEEHSNGHFIVDECPFKRSK